MCYVCFSQIELYTNVVRSFNMPPQWIHYNNTRLPGNRYDHIGFWSKLAYSYRKIKLNRQTRLARCISIVRLSFFLKLFVHNLVRPNRSYMSLFLLIRHSDDRLCNARYYSTAAVLYNAIRQCRRQIMFEWFWVRNSNIRTFGKSRKTTDETDS